MATTSWLNILNKANPQPALNEDSIRAAESGAVAASHERDKLNPRLRQIELDRELEQLEAQYATLHSAGGKSWALTADEHRQVISELESVLERARRISKPDDRTKRKLEKIRVELEGRRRKLVIAEGRAAANAKQRVEFEKDHLPRLRELRTLKAERRASMLDSVDIEHAISSL